MSADFFRVLLAYNRWANDKVLARTAEVGQEAYFAKVEGLSFGNLHATLVHILVGELVWLARFQGRLPPETLKDARVADRLAESKIRTFEELISLWREEWRKQDEYLASLQDEDGARPLSYLTQYGEPNAQPLEQLMAHLVNHGTQFRAEAAVRLTQTGALAGRPGPDRVSKKAWLRRRFSLTCPV